MTHKQDLAARLLALAQEVLLELNLHALDRRRRDTRRDDVLERAVEEPQDLRTTARA